MRDYLILFFIIICTIGCQKLQTEPQELGELPISLSLQPALENGFEVTAVHVTITKDNYVNTILLAIDDSINTATGTFYELEPGVYSIEVQVFEDDTLIAFGSGSGEVFAGGKYNRRDYFDHNTSNWKFTSNC